MWWSSVASFRVVPECRSSSMRSPRRVVGGYGGTRSRANASVYRLEPSNAWLQLPLTSVLTARCKHPPPHERTKQLENQDTQGAA